MTYYLARKNGFKPDQAVQIAGAAQFVDDSPRTKPRRFGQLFGDDPQQNARDSFILETFHFAVDPRAWGVKPNSDSSNAIFNKALGNLYPSSLGARVNPSSENLIMAGVGLHVLADSYSHEGYGIAKDPAGHIPNDWLGGPETDNPTIPKHKDKALEMAKRVNERLQDLAQTLGMSWERFYKGTDLEKDIAPFFAQASETRYNPYMAPGSPGSTYQVKVPKTKAVRIVEWQALIKQLGPDEYWDYNVVRQRFDTGGRYSGAFNSVVDELIPRDMR